MFAFCEKWLAQNIGVDYVPYTLNSNEEIAIVSRTDTLKIINIIKEIFNCNKIKDKLSSCKDYEKVYDIKIQTVNSNISGVKIILHPFWINDNILFELTPSNLNEELYNFICLNNSGNRFIFDDVVLEIKRLITPIEQSLPNIASEQEHQTEVIHNEQLDQILDELDSVLDKSKLVSAQHFDSIEASSINENIIAKDENSSILPVDDEEIKIINFKSEVLKYINNYLLIHLYKKQYSVDEKNIGNYEDSSYLVTYFLTKVDSEYLKDFFYEIKSIAENIKKHIIIIEFRFIHDIATYLNNNFDINIVQEIKKNILFFFIERMNYPLYAFNYNTIGFDCVERRNVNINCFGYELYSIFVLKNKSKETSSFNNFNMVYKDHISNLIWGIQKENMVFFMIPIVSNVAILQSDKLLKENHNLCMKLIFKEFSNRYLKKYTLKEIFEIDKNYILSKNIIDREKYVEYVIDNSTKYISDLKEIYNEYRSKYLKSYNEVLEYSKLMDRTMEKISHFDFNDFIVKQKEKALSSYDECLNLKKVLSISLKNDTVNVNTKNLYVNVGDKWYDIGTFLITIGINSNKYDENNTIKIINTKHTINGYENNMNAPHVFSDGRICHGNLGNQLITSYRNRDLYSLVYQIIIFLESVNTSDAAGKHVVNWPEVTKEIALKDDDLLDYNTMYKISEKEKVFDDKIRDFIPIKI